jgi:serine protease Do
MKVIPSESVATAVAALSLGAGGACFGNALISPARAAANETATSAIEAHAGHSLPDFSAIVREFGPAVVNVSTVAKVRLGTRAQPRGDSEDNPFGPYFRRGQPFPRRNVPVHGFGSGFIVRPDGLVLTNAHVVEGANEVTVKLTDKREFRAKVLGLDGDTDVAVLKIDAKGLPTVKIGEPARTQVGDWVLAIGSPFGFENSATAGIVSARSRSLPGAGYVPFIQTDVAVNPGNSGGPLFNLAGEVIGINSQIYSGSGGYMGISFAIPINVAMNVQEQLVAHGRVERGRLGITIQEVNQDLARSFGLPKPSGALVSTVANDSPAAAAAGLKAGDVILGLNGEEIAGSDDLPPRIAALKPGATARLTIWRDHARRDIEVKLAEARGFRVAPRAEGSTQSHGRLGLAVRPLTPEEQREAAVERGAMVEEVSGPAAEAGVEPGDVLLAVNGAPVTGTKKLWGLVAKAGDHFALLVKRGQAQIYLPVDLG